MMNPAPADAPDTRASPAAASDPRGPADAEAFGELGPVLAAAFVLWLAIVAAVAAAL